MHRTAHTPTGLYKDPPASATMSPPMDCGVYIDSKMNTESKMVMNLLPVDMTSNAVALRHSRLPLDAEASATPMKQLVTSHAVPDGESLSYSEALHSNKRDINANGSEAVALRYTV